MEENNKENVIYTDQQATRLQLRTAYEMYAQHFRGYNQARKLGKIDGILLSGTDKWADECWFESKDFIDDFKSKITDTDIQKFKGIFKKTKKTYEDYRWLRDFMPTFLKKVGIRDLTREKDNPDTAVEDELF